MNRRELIEKEIIELISAIGDLRIVVQEIEHDRQCLRNERDVCVEHLDSLGVETVFERDRARFVGEGVFRCIRHYRS